MLHQAFFYRRYDVNERSDVTKEITIDQETVLNHLKKTRYKNRVNVCEASDKIMKKLIY